MKNQTLYAIADIETTGSYARGCHITELAIYIHNGQKIIDHFHSLVNPAQEIPYYIQSLTGIDPHMVEQAPLFEDIAQQVYHLLEGKVFVAHNVNFDYSFLHHQLKECGYHWSASRLCTVRLSRKVFQNLPSYSLGRLCQSLKIPLNDRHRAAGDARATVQLFEMILARDQEHILAEASLLKSKDQRLPCNIPLEQFERLPQTPGVYIFRNKAGKLLYVGKALNIQKRVNSHFTGNNSGPRRQLFLREIHSIEHEETGTELMALLRECHLIKQYCPVYNKALKKYEPKFGLIDYMDRAGYLRLCIGRVVKGTPALAYFDRVQESTKCLLQLIETFNLDTSLCSFFQENRDPGPRSRRPAGPIDETAVDLHNARVQQAIEFLQQQKQSFLVLDKGRTANETSYIYYKNNNVHALGYLDSSLSFNHIEEAIKATDLCHSNFYMCQLVRKHAERYPQQVQHVNSGEIDMLG